jgi:hypothetical protein
VTSPLSASWVATASSTGTSPKRFVSCVGELSSTRSTSPLASREVIANGWKIVCRHAGPPASERIGAITLTSWAWQATVTRSECRSSEISRLPTTTASATL